LRETRRRAGTRAADAAAAPRDGLLRRPDMDGQARSVVAAQRRCGPRSPSITRAHQEREAPLRHHIKTRLISVRPDAPLATWSGHGEALDAYCRGLFLSAANMLGARSEAPWYTLGRALQGQQPGGALGHALDADQTAQVLRLAAEKIVELGGGRIRSTVLELQAHEATPWTRSPARSDKPTAARARRATSR
jgi:hypothetical protein